MLGVLCCDLEAPKLLHRFWSRYSPSSISNLESITNLESLSSRELKNPVGAQASTSNKKSFLISVTFSKLINRKVNGIILPHPLNPLWRELRFYGGINFLSMLSYSSYVKCGLKCFRFLSNIKIEKIENFDFLKNLQKNVKWILSHSIDLMFKYNWWIPMRIKIMTITLL